MAVGCCGGPAGAGGVSEPANGLENWLMLCWTPAQAESRGVPSRSPIADRRVTVGCSEPVGSEFGLSGPNIASLHLTDRDRPALPPGLGSEERVQGTLSANG